MAAIWNRTIEDTMDRILEKNRRRDQRTYVRTRAKVTIDNGLEGHEEAVQALLAVSMLHEAADAVARLHDGPRLVALLGSISRAHGRAIPNDRERIRDRANRAFRRAS